MHVCEDFDGIRSQPGIHVREAAQRGGHNHSQQVVVAGGEAPILFDLFLDARAGGNEFGGICFGDQGHAGSGVHTGSQALGNDSAHAFKWNAL